MSIPVIWHSQDNGRGRYNCTAMLNDMFDLYDCEHYPGVGYMPNMAGAGAIVVVHGGREIGQEDRLNMDIDPLKWAILIFLGDEESAFGYEKIKHSNAIRWVQEPLPAKHASANRFIIDGYSHDHGRYIVPCDRDLIWSFAGQMTHPRRWECRNALQNIDWGGVIVESKGYCQGVSREEYFRLLCRSKIVPCPSGPFSPDAARPWEALECGAIPILDDLSPTRKEPGFWKLVLGDQPLPVITDWADVKNVIERIKYNHAKIQYECKNWWENYKNQFNSWLSTDLHNLGVACSIPRS